MINTCPNHKNQVLKFNIMVITKFRYHYTRFVIKKIDPLAPDDCRGQYFILSLACGTRLSAVGWFWWFISKTWLVKQVARDGSIPTPELVNLTKQNWSSSLIKNYFSLSYLTNNLPFWIFCSSQYLINLRTIKFDFQILIKVWGD